MLVLLKNENVYFFWIKFSLTFLLKAESVHFCPELPYNCFYCDFELTVLLISRNPFLFSTRKCCLYFSNFWFRFEIDFSIFFYSYDKNLVLLDDDVSFTGGTSHSSQTGCYFFVAMRCNILWSCCNRRSEIFSINLIFLTRFLKTFFFEI